MSDNGISMDTVAECVLDVVLDKTNLLKAFPTLRNVYEGQDPWFLDFGFLRIEPI